MRRRARRLSIGLTLLGMLILAGYSGAYFWFNDAVLGEFISAQVNRAERGRFLLGHARFTWAGGLLSLITDVPTRVVGEDYRLLDPDGREVLVVPRVEADVHLRRLVVSLVKMAVTQRFYLDLHFTHAWIPSGFGVITHTESSWGKANPEINIVAAMTKRHKTPPDGGEFRITVENLQLDHVQFAIGLSNAAGQTSWYGRLWDGAGHAGLVYSSRESLETKTGPFFFFKVKPLAAASGELKLGDFLFPLEQLTAIEFGPDGDAREDLKFEATAKSLGADVKVKGALEKAYTDPGVRLTLDFLHGQGPIKLLPPPLRDWLAGDPEGQLRINGPFSSTLIEADVKGADATIEGVAIRSLSAHLRLASDGVLRFDPTLGQLAGGQVGGKIEVDLGPRAFWRASLSLKNVDPARVPQIPKDLQSKLAGRLDARFRLFGSLVERTDHIAVDDIDGALERSGGGKLPKVVKLGGGLEIMPRKIALRDVQIGADGLTATATGNLETPSGAPGRIDAQLRVDGKASQALHEFGLSPDLKVDTLHAQGSVSGRWPSPKLALHVVAGNVGFAARSLDKLEADLSLAEGALQFDAVKGKGFGGTIEGWAHLGLFDESGNLSRPLKDPTLRAQLDMSGISVSTLSGGNQLQGNAEVHLSLDGPLARPRGHGLATLPNLSIYGDRYQEGRVAVDVGEDGWTLRDIHLQRRGGGVLRGSGKVGWDLSYSLNLQPKDFPMAAFPNAANTPFDGRVAGNLTIEGDGARWSVGGLAQLNSFTFRKALIGDGQLRFEPGGDATRVHGEAFKHFTVDGTLTTYPKFAVSVSITFKDVPLESIFPEARELVDVTGTTTGSARVSFNFDSGLSGTVTLDTLQLTLAGTEEDGRTRRLQVKNRNPVVISARDGKWYIQRSELTSQLGSFFIEAPEISDKTIQASMKGQIGLELLEYFFKNWFDHTDGNAWVDLKVGGQWAAPQVTGQVDMSRVSLQPRGLDHRLNVTAGHVDFSQNRVSLSNFHVNMDGAIAHAQGFVSLDGWKPGAVSGQIDGQLSAKLLQWIFADRLVEASGRLAVNVRLDGQLTQPRWQGMASVVGGLNLQVRRFDHELQFTSGTVQFVGSDLTLGCPKSGIRVGKCEPITGLIDSSSKAELDGIINFGADLQPQRVDIHLSGSEIRHATQTYRLVMSPRVRLLSLDGQHYELSGTVQLVEGRYTQKFEMKDWVVKPRAVEVEEPWWQGDPRLETLKLSLHAQATGPLLVDVGWARINITSAALDISNTLSDPRLQGTMLLEEGGTLNPPLIRIPFQSDAGRIYFSQDKRIPDETPTLDLLARGICTDRLDNQHEIQLQISGTLSGLNVLPRSLDGWDQSAIGFCLISGHTQEDVRHLTQGGGDTSRGGTSATEGVAKIASGAFINEMLSDPVRKLIGFDTTSIELGGSSVDVKLCKRLQRYLKACGQGELGFVGGSRASADLQLRFSDYISALARIEYLSQGIDTLQDTNTRFKLEANVRFPLGY